MFVQSKVRTHELPSEQDAYAIRVLGHDNLHGARQRVLHVHHARELKTGPRLACGAQHFTGPEHIGW